MRNDAKCTVPSTAPLAGGVEDVTAVDECRLAAVGDLDPAASTFDRCIPSEVRSWWAG